MSWTIGNKEVQSLHIGNKEVQSIVRVSDSKVLYEKPVSYSISLVADKYTASAGETVTFTATVTNGSGSPVVGETVTFKEGANVLGTGVTNASGICSVSYSWNYTNLLYITAKSDSTARTTLPIIIGLTFFYNTGRDVFYVFNSLGYTLYLSYNFNGQKYNEIQSLGKDNYKQTLPIMGQFNVTLVFYLDSDYSDHFISIQATRSSEVASRVRTSIIEIN